MGELIKAIQELGNLSWIDYIQLGLAFITIIISALALFYAIKVPKRIAEDQNRIALFDKRYEEIKNNAFFDKQKYIADIDWYKLIKESKEINNSLTILKNIKKEIITLTKVNSYENEARAKVRIFRENGLDNTFIFVPYDKRKTEIVSAKGNILIDDTVHNLEDWELDEGIPIFFNKHYKDIDGWDRKNTKYKKIKSLEYLKTL